MKYKKEQFVATNKFWIQDIRILPGDIIWTIEQNGKEILHRDDGPAFISFEDKTKIKKYFINGKLHREDGPAYIFYFEGKIKRASYFQEGKLHRVDGPAEIIYNNENILSEKYFKFGKKHREDGPSCIRYNKKGKVKKEQYWINGNKIGTVRLNLKKRFSKALALWVAENIYE